MAGAPLASGQAVRRLTLDQEIEGSNPSSPASSPRVAVQNLPTTTSGGFVREERDAGSKKEPRAYPTPRR